MFVIFRFVLSFLRRCSGLPQTLSPEDGGEIVLMFLLRMFCSKRLHASSFIVHFASPRVDASYHYLTSHCVLCTVLSWKDASVFGWGAAYRARSPDA